MPTMPRNPDTPAREHMDMTDLAQFLVIVVIAAGLLTGWVAVVSPLL